MSGGAATPPRRRRWTGTDPGHPRHDRRYAEVDPTVLPDVEIAAGPRLAGAALLAGQHRAPAEGRADRADRRPRQSSLRALVKHLDGISDEDIPQLNIPTGSRRVYTLTPDTGGGGKPATWGDPEEAAKAARAVAEQAKRSRPERPRARRAAALSAARAGHGAGPGRARPRRRARGTGRCRPIPTPRWHGSRRTSRPGGETQAELDRRAQEAEAEVETAARPGDGRRGRAIVERQAVVRDHRPPDLADLTAREAARLAELEAGRARLSRLLGGLQRLATGPGGGAAGPSRGATHTVRSALLLRAAVPSLEAEAAEVARTVDHLTALRAEDRVPDGVPSSRSGRRLGADLADPRSAGRPTTGTFSPDIGGAAGGESRNGWPAWRREAEDLSGLIDRLESERRAAGSRRGAAEEAARFAAEEAAREASERAARIRSETTRPMPDVAVVEGVILPTAGEVVLRYGQADGRGEVSRGLRLQADPRRAGGCPPGRYGPVRRSVPGLRAHLDPGTRRRIFIRQLPGWGGSTPPGRQDVLAGEPIAVTPLPQSRAIDSTAAGPGTVAAVADAAGGDGRRIGPRLRTAIPRRPNRGLAGPTRTDAEANDGAPEEGGARLSDSGAGSNRPMLYFEFPPQRTAVNPISRARGGPEKRARMKMSRFGRRCRHRAGCRRRRTSPDDPGAGRKFPQNTYRQLNLFGEVFERVRAEYVEDVTDQDLIEGRRSTAWLTALDPHSSYLDADTFQDMQVQTRGSFGGLGIEVTMENGFVLVVSPIDDNPAFRAGLQAGDVHHPLDGEPLQGPEPERRGRQECEDPSAAS